MHGLMREGRREPVLYSTRAFLLGDLAAQQIKEHRAILIIAKDVLARIPARGNVIQRSGVFKTERTGHSEMVIRLSPIM